jgi:hypothetical protein
MWAKCGQNLDPKPDPSPSQQRKTPQMQGFPYGRYWARTSDLRLVEAALSQLS